MQQMLTRKGEVGSRCSTITVHDAVTKVTRLTQDSITESDPSSPLPPSPSVKSVQALRRRFTLESGVVKDDTEPSGGEHPMQMNIEVELPGDIHGSPPENVCIEGHNKEASDEIEVGDANAHKFSAFLLD